ncbi:MAG TPA: methionine--tRNA ligase [Candidatus Paceibacterota bacterium]
MAHPSMGAREKAKTFYSLVSERRVNASSIHSPERTTRTKGFPPRNSTSNTFYITTTLPYVNAPLHLGHATEIIRADTIARYKKLVGFDVFFNTGTDEHGMKIFEAAQKAGKGVQQFVDEYSALYKETLQKFGVSPDAHYIRTTDVHHIAAAQEFWKHCDKNGFIYKKEYQAKYCIGCEEEKTDSELVNGKCPIHDRVPELINEENYFFKLSAFGDKVIALYDSNPGLVVPGYRLNELREFIKRGLRDFSISRLKKKLPWGIPVPDDDSQVMYVWFDALVNYISTLGWPDEKGDFKKYWVNGAPTQYCGKDNTRFQGLMWQAMLMAAGISPTRTIVVDGFILAEGGGKMSKTLGNVVEPLDIVNEYGTDTLRYFVLREFHPFEDTAVSKEKFKEWYNANLVNGLGNLVSRIMKMAISYNVSFSKESALWFSRTIEMDSYHQRHKGFLDSYNIQEAANVVWEAISAADNFIQKQEPFKKIKSDRNVAEEDIKQLMSRLYFIAMMIEPFMPETSKKIQDLIRENKMPSVPLFPRKE